MHIKADLLSANSGLLSFYGLVHKNRILLKPDSLLRVSTLPEPVLGFVCRLIHLLSVALEQRLCSHVIS